jgi:two-component system sensor histidine kinase/response regulator
METEISVDELLNKVKSLEEENKQLKEREYSLLRALPEIVFILDGREKLTFASDTCLRKFKYTHDDLARGVYLKDILTPESYEFLKSEKKKVLSQNEFNARELIGKRSDNTLFSFTTYTAKLKSGNKTTGFIGIGFDITDRKQVENLLREANHAKVKFFSIIAHDLKNPFNSLVGFSQLLLNGYNKYPPEKIKEFVFYMNKAANQGFVLLENLLEWSRAQTGKLENTPVWFDMVDVVNEVYNLTSGSANKKDIVLTFDCLDEVLVYADMNMIRTVLRNLVSNAVKFTHRQGHIHIKAYLDGPYGVVQVSDNGIGISPENLNKLFKIDSDYSSLGTEKESGTGLGLILCQEFVNMNKGKIEVESKLGDGSVFRVKVPCFIGED